MQCTTASHIQTYIWCDRLLDSSKTETLPWLAAQRTDLHVSGGITFNDDGMNLCAWSIFVSHIFFLNPFLSFFSVEVWVLWKPRPSQPVQRIKEVLFKYLCKEVRFISSSRFSVQLVVWCCTCFQTLRCFTSRVGNNKSADLRQDFVLFLQLMFEVKK